MARSEHRPGSQLPVTPTTLADVAERAGVSRQTVSNAVNNPDLLRPDTLERVRQTIAELGYSPNRAARNLRTRTSSLIGLRFTPAQEGTANAMMDRFVHSLVEASDEAGYHVLLFPADDEDPVGGYDNLLRSTAVDAFVVTDTYLGNPQAAWLSEQRAPVRRVRPSVGRRRRPPRVGRRRRRRRHRGWPPSTSSTAATRASRGSAGARTRPSGRTAAPAGSRTMHANGLSTTGMASRVEDVVHSGAEAAAVLLDESAPTAFVCASDTLAMGVLHTLWIRQLAPGTRHRGGRLRRLPGRAGLPGGPDVRTPAARGRRRRDRPHPERAALPPAGRDARRPPRRRRWRSAGPARSAATRG